MNMKTIATLIALSFALALAGCNTFRGLGQDIQKVGNKIEDKATR
jgi:entericidin A